MATTKEQRKSAWNFEERNVMSTGSWSGRIQCRKEQLVSNPLWWQKQGLTQTASGYGRKLATTYMIKFNGRLHRVYCCCFSNSGTCYIVSGNRKIVVDAN